MGKFTYTSTQEKPRISLASYQRASLVSYLRVSLVSYLNKSLETFPCCDPRRQLPIHVNVKKYQHSLHLQLTYDCACHMITGL
jgi:hypothetical protein